LRTLSTIGNPDSIARSICDSQTRLTGRARKLSGGADRGTRARVALVTLRSLWSGWPCGSLPASGSLWPLSACCAGRASVPFGTFWSSCSGRSGTPLWATLAPQLSNDARFDLLSGHNEVLLCRSQQSPLPLATRSLSQVQFGARSSFLALCPIRPHRHSAPSARPYFPANASRITRKPTDSGKLRGGSCYRGQRCAVATHGLLHVGVPSRRGASPRSENADLRSSEHRT